MVFVVNLNPAVDRICKLDELRPGEVNRLTYARNIAGGKGVNVASVLAKNGTEVAISGFLGGHNGRFIAEAVRNRGIYDAFVMTQANTRCNTNIIAQDNTVTEVLEAGEPVSEAELAVFMDVYEKQTERAKVVVLSGSLPKGVPADIYQRLITIAKKKQCITILDSAGEALKRGILGKPDYIKPNLAELCELVGLAEKTEEAVYEACMQLQAQGISNVFVSMGETGLRALTKQAYYLAGVPKITVKNTVACGDCVVAVMAMGCEYGWNEEECVRKAAAMSAANATTEENGDMPQEVIDKLLGEIKLEIRK